jgi:Tfp pilus assembly protein PilV
MTLPQRRVGGFTLTEVVVAATLLIIAIVPILKALTTAQANSSIIERKTLSLTLAQAKLDDIKARSIYDYSNSFVETNSPIRDFYLCSVEDNAVNVNLREIKVSVGEDLNRNSVLEDGETQVTLATLIARRW